MKARQYCLFLVGHNVVASHPGDSRSKTTWDNKPSPARFHVTHHATYSLDDRSKHWSLIDQRYSHPTFRKLAEHLRSPTKSCAVQCFHSVGPIRQSAASDSQARRYTFGSNIKSIYTKARSGPDVANDHSHRSLGTRRLLGMN